MKAIRKTSRLTRRSFRRKLIMFGASIFASLAITATGFAAWVLSTDATAETEGGVQVGSVSDAGVEIKDLTFNTDNTFATPDMTKNVFKFEPAAGDITGRVQWDKDTQEAEVMELYLSWTVKNYQNVKNSYIEFKIPASVQDAITNSEKLYLELPAEFEPVMVDGSHKTEEKDGVVYYLYNYAAAPAGTTSDGENGKGLSWERTSAAGSAIVDLRFEYTLMFNWGDKFANTNPSEYYDSETLGGKAVEFQVMKDTLLDLKLSVYGVEDTAANRAAAVDKIADQPLKTEAQSKSKLIEILDLMTDEEQDAFFESNNPKYFLVVHAEVN